MFGRRRITETDLEIARSEAATNAKLETLNSAFAAHVIECGARYREQEATQKSMHLENKRMYDKSQSENIEKFDKINRVIWIALGIGLALTFLGGKLGHELFGLVQDVIK